MVSGHDLHTVTWVEAPPRPTGDGAAPVLAQCSAHGRPVAGSVRTDAGGDGLVLTFADPQRRVAPGQTVALYDPVRPDSVLGSGIVR